MSPNDYYQQRALCEALPAIYKIDPKAALAQARSISDAEIKAKALTDLADLMPTAQAASVYQEAEDDAIGYYGNGYSPACVANHAWQRDQALGAKLFKAAYTKFVTCHNTVRQAYQQLPSHSDFAFYYSVIDPAYSRVLLDAQFVRTIQDSSPNQSGDSVQAVVTAMSAIDINHALELARQIKGVTGSFDAGLKPAQYVLLTPQQRNAIPFSDWVSNPDWVPGTPSN